VESLAEAARVAAHGEIVPLDIDVTVEGAAEELRKRARERAGRVGGQQCRR
jgi:hypothetical protein